MQRLIEYFRKMDGIRCHKKDLILNSNMTQKKESSFSQITVAKNWEKV